MKVKVNTFLRIAVYLSGFKNIASVVQSFRKRSFVGSRFLAVRGFLAALVFTNSDKIVLIEVFALFGIRA